MMFMKFYDEIPWYELEWWNSMMFMKFYGVYEILWWNSLILKKENNEIPWHLWNSMKFLKYSYIFKIHNHFEKLCYFFQSKILNIKNFQVLTLIMVMRMKFLKILPNIAKYCKTFLHPVKYCETQFYSFEKLIKNYSKF